MCHYKVLIGRLHSFNSYALQWIFDHRKILIIDGMRFHFLSFADVYEPMCPTNIEQSTDNGSNGANVSFSMRFTDNVDPSPTANCDHQSGATYPVGTTVVTCNVTDSSSNINQCSFTITITGN